MSTDLHGSKKIWTEMANSMARDWDTDGDGMPDGFEFCFSDESEHPLTEQLQHLKL